tara:strand:+ start:1000 stop:1251 length:252 start_codon:yes stop_codon:yes gene_type:complete
MKTQKFNSITFTFTNEGTKLGRGVLEAILQDLFNVNFKGKDLANMLPVSEINLTQTKNSFECNTEKWWVEAFKVNSIDCKFNN